MPEVLATAVLLAMMEAACIEHIAGLVTAPVLSLGRRAELDHLAATPIGFEVEITTRLVSAEGRQLAFDITASDGIEVVGRARHDRVVVDRDRFAVRLADKAGRVPR
jgi:predicted thioesterase